MNEYKHKGNATDFQINFQSFKKKNNLLTDFIFSVPCLHIISKGLTALASVSSVVKQKGL